MTPTAVDDRPLTPATPAAFEALDERFERVPIDDVVPSLTNPRHHFDETYIAQLAESVAEKGIIQPLVVRPFGAKKPNIYEIVAGECRYRASRKAHLTHLPCIIRNLTNDQALELQLIENIHRNDLTPLEQAAGYRALIKSNPDKHSAASIAERIGKSASWVWDLMKLLDLIPAAKEILDQGLMTIGHAILIARLKPEDQKRVIGIDRLNGYGNSREGLWQFQGGALEFEDAAAERKGGKAGKYDDVKAVSVRELDAWIRDHIRFDVAHAAKAQPMVFEETAATVEQAAAQPGRGKKVISITHEYRVADDARDEEERTYGSQSWQRADGKFKSKTCDHSVLGLVVAGRGQGETFDVCVARDKCTVHFGAVIRQKEKNAKLREKGHGSTAAARESAQLARDRQKREEAERQEKAWAKLEPLILADAIAQVKAAKTITPAQAKALFESDLWNLESCVQKHLGASWYKTPAAAWLVGGVASALGQCGSFDAFVKDVARPFGLDLKRLEALRAKAEPVATSGVKKAAKK